MKEEAEIIKGCIRNDRKAQKKLYEKYASVLLGVCRRYSADLGEAEDILQEGLVKVYLNLRSFTGKGTLLGWMKRIMINTAITWYHKNLKHRYHSDIEDAKNNDVFSNGLNDSDFTRDELQKIIDELPPGYKMIFNMYAIEGYKHKEIAHLMKIDINTSKSQYSRARKMIREKLAIMSKKCN